MNMHLPFRCTMPGSGIILKSSSGLFHDFLFYIRQAQKGYQAYAHDLFSAVFFELFRMRWDIGRATIRTCVLQKYRTGLWNKIQVNILIVSSVGQYLCQEF